MKTEKLDSKKTEKCKNYPGKIYSIFSFGFSNDTLAVAYGGGLILGITLADLWIKTKKRYTYEHYFKGIRLYHSSFAAPLIFVSLFTPKPISMILLGTASGLIIHCAIKYKLKFYELTKGSDSDSKSKGR